MKNAFTLRRLAIYCLARTTSLRLIGSRLVFSLALMLAAVGLVPQQVSRAQRPGSTKVVNVSVQSSGNGDIAWINADGPIPRAQNWQDSEGFHLVLPNTVALDSVKTVRGISFRRVGNSLEVLLKTKPGTKVNLLSDGNEINILVDKKLETRSLEAIRQSESSQNLEPSARPVYSDPPPFKLSTPSDLAANTRPASGEAAQNSSNWNPPMGPAAALPSGQTLPSRDPAAAPTDDVPVQVEDEGALASIFSVTSLFVVIALGLFGLLVTRKLRSRQALAKRGKEAVAADADAEWVEEQTVDGRIRPQAVAPSPGEQLVRTNSSVPSRAASVRMTVSGPTSLFGAYRIDQEVGKLLLGQPHRMDVLASRAIDDRRAIETSLIKGIHSSDFDESAQRRARSALEEYGFVARQCATLLLATDPFERTSAARSLGEIKSEAALPFLLESLYDSESIVRNQAVVSIGELKVPSAIGALLDIARTHPDVPSTLLSKTLSACSVEGLDFFDAMPIEPAQLGMGNETGVIAQITRLEPAYSAETLPEEVEDEQAVSALAALHSEDVQERSEALKTLAQFRSLSVIEGLVGVVRHEPEPSLRSIAISSLAAIDHESVFPAVLIAMADESREVRASAARALSRLSFDRAEAYARVIETSDEETLSGVAKACVQAGIVSQNLDRLAVCDHHQAYETFALICLLSKANMNDPILEAIAGHPKLEVRLAAVHLLASTGQPGTFEILRQLAVREGVREDVKTAILEAMYRLDQAQKGDEAITVVEDAETSDEVHFETDLPEASNQADELVDSDLELGFDFAFGPAARSDGQPEFGPEVQQDLDELEM
ncbi:MAG TPA: HEAT repeat domain-containing protein [Pyrinomonadaceae bacterium]|nr:HEAT repeat domain-containing protein [Pyrinomonadaceae bacterium]